MVKKAAVIIFVFISILGLNFAASKKFNGLKVGQRPADFIINLAEKNARLLNFVVTDEILRCYDIKGNFKSYVLELQNTDEEGFIEIAGDESGDVIQLQWGYSPIRSLRKIFVELGEDPQDFLMGNFQDRFHVISYGGQYYLIHPSIASCFPSFDTNILRLEDKHPAFFITDVQGQLKLVSNSAPGFPDEFDYVWHQTSTEYSPNLLWEKVQKKWMGGLSTENVWSENTEDRSIHFRGNKLGHQNDKFAPWPNRMQPKIDRLVIQLNEDGRGGQIKSTSPSFHYGFYKASIKASQMTECDTSNLKGVTNGFFVYQPGATDDYFEEIDVEILSREPEYVYFTIWRGRKLFNPWRKTHWKWSKKVKVGRRTDRAFHSYGFKWLPDRIEFYVDNFREPKVVYHESDDKSAQHIPNQNAYLIFNNWTGSKYWSGENPQKIEKMFIDWVDYSPLEENYK
ncbi:MAG: glycoside hydrolase family 16 protein [Candidatus Aminicenantes bacterium]|nr:MAG: glycoside hydrolase family 16 protein [Candidatus Aminicenantes bacterium]